MQDCKLCEIHKLYIEKFGIKFNHGDCPFDCSTKKLKEKNKPWSKSKVKKVSGDNKPIVKSESEISSSTIALAYIQEAVKYAYFNNGELTFYENDAAKLPEVAVDLLKMAVKTTAERLNGVGNGKDI